MPVGAGGYILFAGGFSGCLESLPILWSDLVRAHPGRPAALPTATGWEEELLDRAAGVYDYRGRGTPSHRRRVCSGHGARAVVRPGSSVRSDRAGRRPHALKLLGAASVRRLGTPPSFRGGAGGMAAGRKRTLCGAVSPAPPPPPPPAPSKPRSGSSRTAASRAPRGGRGREGHAHLNDPRGASRAPGGGWWGGGGGDGALRRGADAARRTRRIRQGRDEAS